MLPFCGQLGGRDDDSMLLILLRNLVRFFLDLVPRLAERAALDFA
jgi:hypothetical protein